LEYAAALWSPYTKDIELIENVQRRATKQVPSLKQLSYTDRLKKLKMPTLKYRRLRGDMIETFKITNGIYDKDVTERFFEMSRTDQTRGHTARTARFSKKSPWSVFFRGEMSVICHKITVKCR
jgi:hypothetical protein